MPMPKVTRYVTKKEAKTSRFPFSSERCIDTRTGENISKVEAIKRETANKATRNLESEVIKLRAEVARLTSELEVAMDDLRRVWRQSSRI